MSSKRFGPKPKKPKDKEKKAKQKAEAADKGSKFTPKGANVAKTHFQRRTSG